MPRFNEDDLNKEQYVPLTAGKYPVKIQKPILYDDNGGKLYDREGRQQVKVRCEVIAGPNKGRFETWMLSPHWMQHLTIHFMRAVGWMDVQVVDVHFREDPADTASYDMNTVIANLEGCRALMEIREYTKRDGKPGRSFDFYPLLDKDGKPVGQPKWVEAQAQVYHYVGTPDSTPPGPPADYRGDEEFDLDEEDEEFLLD